MPVPLQSPVTRASATLRHRCDCVVQGVNLRRNLWQDLPWKPAAAVLQPGSDKYEWWRLAAGNTLLLLERQQAAGSEMNDAGQCQSRIDLDQNQNHWWARWGRDGWRAVGGMTNRFYFLEDGCGAAACVMTPAGVCWLGGCRWRDVVTWRRRRCQRMLLKAPAA